MIYEYGMKHRPYSIGSQPKGVIAHKDDPNKVYWNIIYYKSQAGKPTVLTVG